MNANIPSDNIDEAYEDYLSNLPEPTHDQMVKEISISLKPILAMSKTEPIAEPIAESDDNAF